MPERNTVISAGTDSGKRGKRRVLALSRTGACATPTLMAEPARAREGHPCFASTGDAIKTTIVQIYWVKYSIAERRRISSDELVECVAVCAKNRVEHSTQGLSEKHAFHLPKRRFAGRDALNLLTTFRLRPAFGRVFPSRGACRLRARVHRCLRDTDGLLG